MYNMNGGVPIRGWKNAVFVALKVFSLESFTVGAFGVHLHYQVLSRKKILQEIVVDQFYE